MEEWREILTFPWSECRALSSDHHPPLQTFSPLHLQRSLPNATLSQPLPQARVSDVRYAIPINCKVRTPKRMHVYFVKLHSSLCSSFAQKSMPTCLPTLLMCFETTGRGKRKKLRGNFVNRIKPKERAVRKPPTRHDWQRIAGKRRAQAPKMETNL